MPFDYSTVDDPPRIPDWSALCLQLVECLRWYEYYLTGFQLEDYERGEDGARWEADIKQATTMHEQMETWITKGPPAPAHKVIKF